jgi:hypothetical protein
MNIFLGDRVTLMKGETWVTGNVNGVVLDDKREISRVYIEGITDAFWMSDNWKFVDEESDEWDEREDEDGEI